MNKSLKIISLVVGIPLGLFLLPWVSIMFMFVGDDIRKQAAERAEEPVDLAHAVCQTYATPERVAAQVARGGDIHQMLPRQGQPPMTLMAYAAGCGKVDVIEWMLAHGGRVEDVEMLEVIVNGEEDVARLLIAHGARLDAKDPIRSRPDIGPDLLQAAAYSGQAWLVPVLAHHGHDVQMVNDTGESLLDIATMYAGSHPPEIVKALVDAGTHVNPLNEREYPPLYWAARSNRLDFAQELLAAGANVDAPVPQKPPANASATTQRMTALSQAVEDCQLDMVALLLKHGASKSVVIEDDKALEAGACWHNDYPPYKERAKMLALLAR